LNAHGIVAALTFVILFPLGGIIIRLPVSIPGLMWIHVGWQITAYLLALAALGMGAWLASTLNLVRVTLFHSPFSQPSKYTQTNLSR
jgi:hypothetical protein